MMAEVWGGSRDPGSVLGVPGGVPGGSGSSGWGVEGSGWSGGVWGCGGARTHLKFLNFEVWKPQNFRFEFSKFQI